MHKQLWLVNSHCVYIIGSVVMPHLAGLKPRTVGELIPWIAAA